MRTKLCAVILLVMGLSFCAQMTGTRSISKLSPAWWNTYRARQKRHPAPKIYIIYNSHQLGYVYNDGEKFSDSEFKAYVYGLAITKRCKGVRFFRQRNLHGKYIIKGAVLEYE